MKRLSYALLATLSLTALPASASAQVAPDPFIPPFAQRAVLATVGSSVGFVAAGYGIWALKGGSEGCDLCWEFTVGAFAGSILGAAWATTLAGGEMGRGLKGALLGTAAGLAAVGLVDALADPGDEAITLSFALPHSLITAWLSGP